VHFVNRRKLIFIHREKRILLVAFSRKMVTFARTPDQRGPSLTMFARDEHPDRMLALSRRRDCFGFFVLSEYDALGFRSESRNEPAKEHGGS